MKRIQVEIGIEDVIGAMMPNRKHSIVIDKDTIIDLQPVDNFEYYEDLRDHVESVIDMLQQEDEIASED